MQDTNTGVVISEHQLGLLIYVYPCKKQREDSFARTTVPLRGTRTKDMGRLFHSDDFKECHVANLRPE